MKGKRKAIQGSNQAIEMLDTLKEYIKKHDNKELSYSKIIIRVIKHSKYAKLFNR
ncbi:MAG: hypothetical protein ACXVHR_10370 [Methanobacterium sp.]